MDDKTEQELKREDAELVKTGMRKAKSGVVIHSIVAPEKGELERPLNLDVGGRLRRPCPRGKKWMAQHRFLSEHHYK
jgi:hypothetical protein